MAKRKKPAKRDPLLLEVAAAIGAGGITIGPIHDVDERERLHGIIEGFRIRINPAVSVCDTAIHECIHRLRPEWSELAVRSRTGKIMRQLTDHEIDTIYNLVLIRAKKAKSVLVSD